MLLRIPAVLLVSFGMLAPTAGDSAMKTEHQDSFDVAGYSVRTNNAADASGHGKIGPLWQRWFAENLAAKIPSRVGNDVLAVYSNYASDEKGDYTHTLGARVSGVDKLPEGVTYRKIVAGRYAVFITENGPVTQVVPAEWQKIWAVPASELGGKRAFLTDFEVYDRRAADPQHTQVDIHIGVQEPK
jgi:predicted transcriptional regulator YdeE